MQEETSVTENTITNVEMELEASVQRQRSLLKSIRLCATRLCTVAAIGMLLTLFTTNNSKLKVSDATESSVLSPNKLSRVQKPKKLVDTPHHEEFIRKLREEFHEWALHHGRDYGSDDERERRFHVWKENHIRTQRKNEKHGPCKMTGKSVFGSNHLKDLTPEEFQSKYLTGYKGPRTDELPNERRKLRSDQLKPDDILRTSSNTKRRASPIDVLSSDGLHDPNQLSEKIRRHESVHERFLQHVQQAPLLDKTYYSREEKQKQKLCNCGSSYYYNSRSLSSEERHSLFGKTYYNKKQKQKICGYSKTYYNSNKSKSNKVDCSKYKMEAGKDYETSNFHESGRRTCSWYDASCWLRSIFQPIYSITNENKYSNYNYPSSIDWRKIGAVTSIHSQGSCGACWAITAVETIESANYIATGELLDLSEQEIIICDDSCEMCSGGWPQNAYEYAMENNGLPKETGYDGDLLMTMTMVKEGQSDELTENEMESIREATCPASNSGSQKNNQNNNEQQQQQRYAQVEGYAYATDRCVCYTDGTGCSCDEQNEMLAVMNVASYGPATVCLDASTWQDYTGGIITADSGCSSEFLEMNHCVQAVGYAFQEVEGDEIGNEDKKSRSHDDKNKKLEGYWIIRNQWSKYWGMNGYAYVAMGSNTCGVLNDMTQVFVKS